LFFSTNLDEQYQSDVEAGALFVCAIASNKATHHYLKKVNFDAL
jgi:hypothetical protein